MKLYKSVESAPVVETPVVDMEQALLDLEIADSELQELFDEGVQIAQSYEIYSMIVDTIEKCGGVTKSMEAMFGENFTSVDTMKDEASAEAFEWAEKAWNWIVTFFKKMWAWVSSLWTSTDSVRAQLRELKGKAANVVYPFEIKRSKAIRELGVQLTLINMIESVVKGSANLEDLDNNAAAVGKVEEKDEKFEIKSAADLIKEIEQYEEGFKKMFELRETFEKIQKSLDKDAFKPAEPKEGEQPAEGQKPANKGKFAELQAKVMNIGKLIQKGNRALTGASKMLIAQAKVK